jgi:hypothetical protein
MLISGDLWRFVVIYRDLWWFVMCDHLPEANGNSKDLFKWFVPSETMVYTCFHQQVFPTHWWNP